MPKNIIFPPLPPLAAGTAQDIMEVQRQAALLKTDALQSAIFNSAHFSSIATDANGVIQIFNVGAERMLGYAAIDVVNKITPADISDSQEVIARAATLSSELSTPIAPGFEALVFKASHGIEDIYELTYIRRDGSRFPALVSVTALRDEPGGIIGYLLIGTDNTARKQAEEVLLKARTELERLRAEAALRTSEERYRTLFESMDEGFCIIEMMFDEHGKPIDYRFVEVNPSFEKQSGLHEVTGKRVREILPALESYWYEIYGKVALTGEAIRFVNEAQAIGRWFDLYAFRVGGPESRKVAVFFTDISERKRVESNLNVALAMADKANHAKSDFLSSMSHELRTPLNAILGFAQLMQSGLPTPTPLQKRSLDQILKGGWYLLELINEILDLAMIESGKVTLSQESVSLLEVLLECRALIEPQAQARGIDLTFPSFETAPFIRADRMRVKQVLLNFLSNAIKYNKADGAIVVSCTLGAADTLRISVRDTGEGLTAPQLAQLFQPFNRLGKKGSAAEGSGIGLVVTKRLVELMGGTVGAQSTLGVGSVFWMELRLTGAPQIVLATTPVLREPPLLPAWASPRTVLYVEDNPANLELVEQLIARRADLHLLSAVNGSLGIEFARDHMPDVILMDVSLPDMSGLDVLKTLREDPATAPIPILAISAYAMPHTIQDGLQAGFLRYLTKPFVVNDFMEALDQALAFSAPAVGDATGAYAPVALRAAGESDTGRAETL